MCVFTSRMTEYLGHMLVEACLCDRLKLYRNLLPIRSVDVLFVALQPEA